MIRIETTATVGEDHRLTLQLPTTVSPGEHHFVLMIDETSEETVTVPSAPAEPQFEQTPMRREGNVLVYAGQSRRPIDDPVAADREARLQELIRRSFPE